MLSVCVSIPSLPPVEVGGESFDTEAGGGSKFREVGEGSRFTKGQERHSRKNKRDTH